MTKEKNWMEELETALKEEYENEGFRCSVEEVDKITEIARPNVWQACLDVTEIQSKMEIFDDIFDLPEQKILREDSKLGNNEEDKISVLSDLESILTCHCKVGSRKREYKVNNGWIDLLLPLITLKLPRSAIYNLFEAIHKKYIPRHIDSFHLLRLLLLYHDPQLCNFLDSKKVTVESFAKSWFQSLYASSCNLNVILSIWDLYFQKGDPYFVFFLALVIIINDREMILNMKDESKQKIVEVISLLPSNLTVEDVTDFCALAQYYDSKTPSSFKRELETVLFLELETSESSDSALSQALCLPVSVMELISNSEDSNLNSDNREETVRFFLIDCRPAEQYNAGHPPTAFHLDCNLMLQEPSSFLTAVQGLLSCQRQALAANSKAGGEHLCFLGCGELSADQYTHMVVASFLQKHTQFVSLLTGGYEAFHRFLGERADSYLRDHNENMCPVCVKEKATKKLRSNLTFEFNGNAMSSEKSDIFGKIGAVVKLKSVEVKEKLVEYMTNPNVSSNSDTDRHVSSSDKLGKPYRNLTPIFSIAEDHEPNVPAIFKNEPSSTSASTDLIKLSSFLENPRIVTHVKCQEVTYAGYHRDCCLIATDTHLIALRAADERDFYRVAVNRPLSSIAKITCRKKHPEFVTFQYGSPTNITDMDKFLIPRSNEVTKIISEQIMKNVELEKNCPKKISSQ